MRVGVPTEIKSDEYRVALTPAGARELTAAGHEVLVDGISHYCVANMPGAVPITSTRALTNATPALRAAPRRARPQAALAADSGLNAGLNVAGGCLTSEAVARDQGLEWTPPEEALRRRGGMIAPT
jgi:alanine dehydrogenase